ncbi:MAG: hypothetical protein WBR26_20100 [Candidatus Acidiferrum sp.]
MKTLEQMSDLEKRSLARWIRRRMQGRVDPTILAERTDQELLVQYFQNIEDKKRTVTLEGAEDDARNAS